jgi:hypothetical protein
MAHQFLSRVARRCPLSPGVYRLYLRERMIHVGMAVGGATLRSEILAHARGDYGPATQAADRADWEVAPDAAFAQHRFLSVYASATYDASGGGSRQYEAPSGSGRHSSAAAESDA